MEFNNAHKSIKVNVTLSLSTVMFRDVIKFYISVAEKVSSLLSNKLNDVGYNLTINTDNYVSFLYDYARDKNAENSEHMKTRADALEHVINGESEEEVLNSMLSFQACLLTAINTWFDVEKIDPPFVFYDY